MTEVRGFQIQENGETFEIYIESKTTPVLVTAPATTDDDDDDRGGKGVGDDMLIKMQHARTMIRGYTLYALSAFRDVTTAEIEEVCLKFGMKIGGKAGIPYITEGSAESNLEISVKCKFPNKTEQKQSSLPADKATPGGG